MRPLALALLLALAGCFGSGLQQQEQSFADRMARIDKVIAGAEGELKKEAEAQKAELLADYRKLPGDAARGEALGRLNQRAWAWLESGEKRSAEAARARAAAGEQQAAAAMADYRRPFVGRWASVGMELTITADGSVDYRRLGGGSKTSVTAPIREFRKDSFVVGILGLNTTFKIDRPPHEENGQWKMTIDGTELTKER